MEKAVPKQELHSGFAVPSTCMEDHSIVLCRQCKIPAKMHGFKLS